MSHPYISRVACHISGLRDVTLVETPVTSGAPKEVVRAREAWRALIKEAGISRDRILFPLLVGIGRFGPIGIVDLADRVGRDSRKLAAVLATDVGAR
jgi:hypothetical protein